MIKASALLVALAIGLLVAGVLASSLLMVYVSIGVCAVAALLLAAGVLSHWSEIFGRRESRPASAQGAWSAPQAGVSSLPVLASAVSTAAAGGEERHARHEEAGGPPPGEHAGTVPPQQESPVAGRTDDLWERVEEELGSAGKRDTGALSWPAIELPVFRESPVARAGRAPGKAGPREPPAGPSAWIWGRGPGWQPPETSDPAWPPPAAAFAGSSARPEPVPDADDTGPDNDTGPDDAATPNRRPGRRSRRQSWRTPDLHRPSIRTAQALLASDANLGRSRRCGRRVPRTRSLPGRSPSPRLPGRTRARTGPGGSSRSPAGKPRPRRSRRPARPRTEPARGPARPRTNGRPG